MENLNVMASDLLTRVKTSISGRYSTCEPQQVQSLFEPVRKILDKYCVGTLDLFTLNYDPSVEAYCLSKNVPLATGFKAQGIEKVWDNNFNIDTTRELGIRLFKLHGSVTWYNYEGKVVEIGAGFGSPQVTTVAGVKAENMLIYPIVVKPTWSEPYVSLFRHLSDALATARCCVVIGFSYRG